MYNRDRLFALAEAGKSGPVLGVGGSGRLENDTVSHETAVKSEKDVAPENRVERALPRPLSDENSFPVHE